MPVIIIGGIWTGFFTPSESAAIAVVYGLVVCLFYLQVVATEPWMFLPLAKHFEMDMVHIGVLMTANLAIALYTPPVGGTLFVAAKLAKVGIGEITRNLWPLMSATLTIVLLVTYWPALSLWLPRFIASL